MDVVSNSEYLVSKLLSFLNRERECRPKSEGGCEERVGFSTAADHSHFSPMGAEREEHQAQD